MTPAGYTATETPKRYMLRCAWCGELRSVARRNAPKARRWAGLHDMASDCASERAITAQRGR